MVNLRSCMGGLCLIFAAGCSVAPAFQPEATPLTYEESMAHCEQLNQERPAIESLRSLAESTISHSGDSISFRYVIVTREPKDLRIDLLPMEGAFTLGLLVTQGEQILLLNTQDKTYLETEDRAAVLERELSAEVEEPLETPLDLDDGVVDSATATMQIPASTKRPA